MRRRKSRFKDDNITNLIGTGSPFNCRFGGGGGTAQQSPKDNTKEMMLMFQEQADLQEARFQAMETARMQTMMEMEQLRLVHETQLREQIKRADIEAERLLREETLESVEEAEAISDQQTEEGPTGLVIDWMGSIQQGMGS